MSPSSVPACLDENISKRAGNMVIEQVSAKSKPVRGLCLLKRNDAPEVAKEDGYNEDYPDGLSPAKPNATTSFAENSETGRLLRNYPGSTAWRKPMPSADSQRKEIKGKAAPTAREHLG